MRSHACTQHFGRPQSRRALQGHDLLEAQCTGAAQNGADIARILNAIKNHGVAARVHIVRRLQQRGSVQHKTHLSGRRQCAQLGEQGIVQHVGTRHTVLPGQALLRPQALAENRRFGLYAPL